MLIDRDCASARFEDWTTSQRELWPLQNLESNTASLNTGQFTEFFGSFDVTAFKEASRLTIDECEALRARFVDTNDGPLQSLEPVAEWTPDVVDLSDKPDPRAAALDWMDGALGRAFDPEIVLFSWTLIRLADEHHIWCFIVHQLALDGSGRNIVARRLAGLYTQRVGTPSWETSAPGRLSDLLREDAAYRASEEREASRVYWARQTANPPRAPRLTCETSAGSYLAARYTAPLPAATSAAVRDLMAQTGVSSSGLFACLSAIYIHCLTGVSDVIVGLLVSGRVNPTLRGAPGNISNTVPLRIRFDADTTLNALITQTRARVREALRHQRFPLSDMKAAIPTLTGELFSIAVNVMKFDYALEFGSLRAVTHNLSNGPVDDLSISVFEQPGEDGLQIALNGNIGRYTSDELKERYEHLICFLREMCVSNIATKIADIPYFRDTERAMASLNPPAAEAKCVATPHVSPVARYVAPANSRERQVRDLFQEMLGVADVSVEDNFFEIGGHSLLAARLISRLSRDVARKIPLRTIFEHSTPRALAGFLDADRPADVVSPGKPTMILFPGGGVISREVVGLKAALADDFSILMLDYPDWRGQWDVFFDIDKYLAVVLAQVQQVAPTPRPLCLLGYSFGGCVAYAASIMLARLGYVIQSLVIIDGRSPTLDITTSEPSRSVMVSVVEFLRRDRLNRNRQIGKYIGIRAKKPIVRALLRWAGPYMPNDESSELIFHLTAFINASVPMQAIRDWTARAAEIERRPRAPTLLVRSRDNDDEWPLDLGWGFLIPTIDIKLVPGTHFTVIGDENLPAIRSLVLGAAGLGVAQERLPQAV